MRWLRRLFLGDDRSEELRLSKRQLDVARRGVRWTALGSMAAVLGVVATFAVSRLASKPQSDAPDPPSTPIESTATTHPHLALSEDVAVLRAGVSVDAFESRLGAPLQVRDLTDQFAVEPDQGVREHVWLLDGEAGWVQTLSTESGFVWMYTVTACNESWTPHFDATVDITLNLDTFASLGGIEDGIYLHYVRGGDWPGWFLESPGGRGRAWSFHEPFWGYVGVCGESQSDPRRLLMQDRDLAEISDLYFEDAMVVGELEYIETQTRSIHEFRALAKPNLYGDVAFDFPDGRPVPCLHENAIRFVDEPGALFDCAGFYVGVEYYFAETFL